MRAAHTTKAIVPRLQSEVTLGGRPVMWVTGKCSTCISVGGLQLFCIKQSVWQSGNPQSNLCQTPTTTWEDVGLRVTCRCRNAALKPESELATVVYLVATNSAMQFWKWVCLTRKKPGEQGEGYLRIWISSLCVYLHSRPTIHHLSAFSGNF